MVSLFEVAGSSFSNFDFHWRDIHIHRVSGSSTGSTGTEGQTKVGGPLGGVFHYRDSGSSQTRNRSIIWRLLERSVELIEFSFDINLTGNALRLHLPLADTPSSLTVNEQSSSHVTILFNNGNAVYRLILPHPLEISKNSKLLAAGKGLPPSVLLFGQQSSFQGNNSALVMTGSPFQSSLSCSWVDDVGTATFILGSSHSSSLQCIQLSAPDTNKIPERFPLQQSNVINKLWNILPSSLKGSSGDSDHVPLAIESHLFGEEMIVICLYSNVCLRLWSLEERTCVLEYNLSSHFQTEEKSINKVLLKKSHEYSSDSLRFVVCPDLYMKTRLVVFDLLLIESQLLLQEYWSHTLVQVDPFIDISLMNDYMLILTKERGAGARNVFYTSFVSANESYNEAVMLPIASTDVTLPTHKETSEGYLDIMFTPGHLTSQSIVRGLMLCGHKISPDVNLRQEVIAQIEQEVYGVVDLESITESEYYELSSKCWNKFYNCVVQYEQLVQSSLAISINPVNGVITLLKNGAVSFLYSHSHSPMLILTAPYHQLLQLNSDLLTSDLSTFFNCVSLVHEQVSEEVFEAFVRDLRYHGDPHESAKQIVEVLLKEGANSDVNFLLSLRHMCGLINDYSALFDEIIALLSLFDEEEEEREEEEEELMISDDTYCSLLFIKLISSGVRELCYRRIKALFDILLICELLDQSTSHHATTMISTIIARLVKIINNHHIIYWLATTEATPTDGLISMNINDLSIGKGNGVVLKSRIDLLRLHLSSSPQVISSMLHDGEDHTHWTNLLPWLLDRLIKKLWPERHCVILYETLLDNCQYELMETLNEYCTGYQVNKYSRLFLRGCSLLLTGETDNAIQCFVKAYNGYTTDQCLMRLLKDDEDGEGGGGLYWLKLLRLLEQLGSSDGIVQLSLSALKGQSSAVTATLWSNVFKHSLLLKDYDTAYIAIMNNTDDMRRRECLRHFVTVLSENSEVSLLCDFNFSGLEEEVELVLDIGAQSSPAIDSVYYDILYCYHMSRDNFWKAAHKVYEQGLRVASESQGVEALEIQENCFVTAISLLSLLSPKYQWIVKPEDRSSCGVVKLKELKQLHKLIKSKLLLIKHKPSLTSHLSSVYVKPREVSNLLNQFGYFDDSLSLCAVYDMSCVPVYEELTFKCVTLSNTLFKNTGEATPPWLWLDYNDSNGSRLQSRGSSVVDQAWDLLRSYIDTRGKDGEVGGVRGGVKDSPSQLISCVVEKILSLNHDVPQWLIMKLKIVDVQKLLFLLMTFNKQDEAIELVIEYIDAVLGQGKDKFGLKDCLHTMGPPVWLPYNLIDQLKGMLPAVDSKGYQSLTNKLDHYTNTLENLTSVL